MKTIRRIAAVLLCLSLGLSILTLPTFAEETTAPTLTVSQSDAPRGGTATVTVTLDKVGDVAGGSFNVVYSSALTLVKAEQGEALSGRFCTVNERYAANTVRVSFAGVTKLTTAGTVLSLTFKVSDAAPLTTLPITLEKVKLQDENAAVISNAAVSGGVYVAAAGLALSSDSCLAGQAVKLNLSLVGKMNPTGGSFEIVYNPHMLTATAMKAVEKLGNVGISLFYAIDKGAGRIKVSWAASEPVGELGTLATVIFAVDEKASGDTAVSLENIRFYDESGNGIDSYEPENGTVSVVDRFNEQPTLYVVGGCLDENNRATIRIAVDGSGEVFGGAFTLQYDPNLVTLCSCVPQMGCVAIAPEKVSDTSGTMRVSWAEDSPSLDNETVLELTFALRSDTPAELIISDAVLKDMNGADMTNALVHSGKIGITSPLQAPVATLLNKEDAIAVDAVLYDAKYCSDERTSEANLFLAAYQEGRMTMVKLPTDAVSFDGDGIAHVSMALSYDAAVDYVQLFTIGKQNSMIPMSEKAVLEINTSM